jgi:transposase
MSQKEADRAYIFKEVKEKKISLKKASQLLSMSYSHAKRLHKIFKIEGIKGLISKKRGRKSNRAIPKEKRQEIAKIISERYKGCKPLFVSEKLEEYHGIKYSSECIRQLMIEYHLWIPKQKKRKVHQRRARRASEGELVQVDASDHDWFEGRGPRCHLHIFIDDASSKIQSGYFALGETTEAYFRACHSYFEREGRPINIYTDKRGTFKVNHGKKEGETQFKRAMKELGVNIIYAHSPEAKGRVERAFGTLQERLVWEMRIRGISSLEKANEYLPEYLEQHNKRYSEPPRSSFNAHREIDPKKPLKYILCKKEQRIVSKNLEVQFNNEIYQLNAEKDLEIKLKGAKINILTTLEGELAFEYEGISLSYTSYREVKYQKPKMELQMLVDRWSDGLGKSKKPPKHHPWKQSPQNSFY